MTPDRSYDYYCMEGTGEIRAKIIDPVVKTELNKIK